MSIGAAAVVDAWQSARRDALNAALADTEIDATDPAQVHVFLDQHPDLARQISRASITAVMTTIFGIKAGEKVGKKVEEVTDGMLGDFVGAGVGKGIEAGADLISDEAATE